MRLNKGQKMVRMLDLMTRRGGVKASELQERFRLDPRSLRRYLSDIARLDIPVRDDGRGGDRVIAVDPSWRRTGVTLTLAELLSLHFGRKLFDFLEGTSFAGDIEGALERLEPAIPRAHADIARQLDTKFLAVPEPRKNYRGDASDIIDEVVSALVYNNPVDARYRRPGAFHTRYLLHPYTLATYRHGLYLFALDVDAAQVKTFAVERFSDLVRRRRETFPDPAGWRPEAHIAHAFGIISGPPEEVVLAFSEKVAAYVRERTWHPTQTFRTLADGRLELRLQVAVTVELDTWIKGFGEEVQVLGPPALIDRIASSLRAAAGQYA